MRTYNVRALVTHVTRPAVAHSELQWAVRVTWITNIRGYAKKNSRWVFSQEMPKIGQWIDISLL